MLIANQQETVMMARLIIVIVFGAIGYWSASRKNLNNPVGWAVFTAIVPIIGLLVLAFKSKIERNEQ